MSDFLKKPVIFIVDDEPIVLQAVSQTVQSLNCKVKCFSNAAECIGALRKEICNLLITDVNMPKMDGLALLKEAKQIQPLMPVLLVTGYGDIPIAVEAVKAGAFDFVEKPLDEETFIPLIEKALKENKSKDPLSAKAISAAEAKVLQLVAEGMSNKQIAFELDRSIRTIENHRHRLMRKLNVSSTAELVRVAIERGLTK